jgi:hypothetical protein
MRKPRELSIELVTTADTEEAENEWPMSAFVGIHLHGVKCTKPRGR